MRGSRCAVDLYQLELIVSWGNASAHSDTRAFRHAAHEESEQTTHRAARRSPVLAGRRYRCGDEHAGRTPPRRAVSRCSKCCSRSFCSRCSSPVLTAASARRPRRCMPASARSIAPNRLRTAQEFLRRRSATSCRSRTKRRQGEGTNVVFDGRAQFMRFVAPMPGYLVARRSIRANAGTRRRGSDGLQLQFTDAMLNGYDATTRNPQTDEPVVLLDRHPRTDNSSTARSTIRASSPTGSASGR